MAPPFDSAQGRPRSYRCEALTLKNAPLGEADLLVTLYTRDQGKLRAVAKGARRSTSKFVGHLEPLTLVRLSLAQARSLDIITQAQVSEGLEALKGDLSSLAKGLYLAELVDGFGAEAHANQSLYSLAVETLKAIALTPGAELPLRFFELHLLEVSGLMPELYHCVECRQGLTPGRHRFSPNLGGALCLDCTPTDARLRPLSLRALKVLRLLHRSNLAELPSLQLDGALAGELKALLTTTVEFWLDREIRSHRFLEHPSHWTKEGHVFSEASTPGRLP